METGKPTSSFSRNQILALVLAALLTLFLSGYFIALWNENVKIDNLSRINSVAYTKESLQTAKGKVTFLDLDPTESKGKAVITLRTTSGREQEVRVAPLGSVCDREAVRIPEDLAKNEMVEVRGVPGNSKTLVVCKKGTYVKDF